VPFRSAAAGAGAGQGAFFAKEESCIIPGRWNFPGGAGPLPFPVIQIDTRRLTDLERQVSGATAWHF
jgi:hypothetical protein